MSLDTVELEVLLRSGTEKEKAYARRIQPARGGGCGRDGRAWMRPVAACAGLCRRAGDRPPHTVHRPLHPHCAKGGQAPTLSAGDSAAVQRSRGRGAARSRAVGKRGVRPLSLSHAPALTRCAPLTRWPRPTLPGCLPSVHRTRLPPPRPCPSSSTAWQTPSRPCCCPSQSFWWAWVWRGWGGKDVGKPSKACTAQHRSAWSTPPAHPSHPFSPPL